MSWTLKSVQDRAENISVEIGSQSGNDRENEVLGVVVESAQAIVDALGGYVSVSGYGHVNPAEGEPNDQVSLQIVSLPEPGGETPAAPDAPAGVTQDAPPAGDPTAPQGQVPNPGGSVAPPPGAEAPLGGDNRPGLETAPETAAQPATLGDVEDHPVQHADTPEDAPASVENPAPADSAVPEPTIQSGDQGDSTSPPANPTEADAAAAAAQEGTEGDQSNFETASPEATGQAAPGEPLAPDPATEGQGAPVPASESDQPAEGTQPTP